MARHPIDWPAATRVRLRYDENCAVATIDWSEEEIAALSFEERLPEQVFNRLARSFIRLDSLALGNAHASKNEIARLVSQEMKERLWCRWSSFEGIYLSSKCEPVVEAI